MPSVIFANQIDRTMTINERYSRFIDYFSVAMPQADTELNFNDAFQLLVAVMLSAQCTDKRVNMVTPALFAAYPSVSAMAEAEVEDVLSYVKSVSYPTSKAKHLVAAARMIVERYGGQVPSTMDELTALPGVGRKTANVMLAVEFGQSAMPVDTHVFRVSHRIGLVSTRCTTPLSVEKALVAHIPSQLLSRAHHWLILHGRYVCKAIHPQCDECGLREFCKEYSSMKKGKIKATKE